MSRCLRKSQLPKFIKLLKLRVSCGTRARYRNLEKSFQIIHNDLDVLLKSEVIASVITSDFDRRAKSIKVNVFRRYIIHLSLASIVPCTL